MLEVEHVALDKSLPDLFVGPRDEHLVVVVGLLRQADAEVDGHAQVHALPVGFQKDAELLQIKLLEINIYSSTYIHLGHHFPNYKIK